MKNQGKKQTFELSALNANNLVELNGFEDKQIQLALDNPFQPITDNKTFEIAKQRRTALKTGRTTIQNQDKTIGSFLQSFRKGTMSIAKKLVEITKESEEKQQAEIDRYQEILDKVKKEKEEAEEIRVQGIKDKIEEVKEGLKVQIDGMTFERIQHQESQFNVICENEKQFDFEIFQFLFDEMIEEKRIELKENVIYWEKSEEKRLEQLEKDQQAKVNEVKLECLELIENATIENESDLIESINNICKQDFDFGDFSVEIGKIGTEMIDKSMHKIEVLKEEKQRNLENEIQIQKNSVINVREGLLDLIFQMTVDNYEEEKEKIQKALKQPSVPVSLVKDEFDKMIKRVTESLIRKLEEIDGELIKAKEEEEAEEKRMEGVMKDRIKIIKDLGMVEDEERCEFFGFGLKYDVSEVYEAETMEYITDEINVQIELVKFRMETIKKIGYKFDEKGFEGFGVTYCLSTIENQCDDGFERFVKKLKNVKKTNKLEIAKKKRLDPERETLIDWIDNGIRRSSLSANLKQPEIINEKMLIEQSLNLYCDNLIKNLKSI